MWNRMKLKSFLFVAICLVSGTLGGKLYGQIYYWCDPTSLGPPCPAACTDLGNWPLRPGCPVAMPACWVPPKNMNSCVPGGIACGNGLCFGTCAVAPWITCQCVGTGC